MSEAEKTGAAVAFEADRLAALACYRILDTPPESAFEDIVDLVASILEAPIAVVNLIDADRQWFKARRGLPMQETGVDISICAQILLQPGLTVVPDLAADRRFQGNPLIGDPDAPDGAGLRFYAGAPLMTPTGLPLGTLCVLDVAPRPNGLTDRQRFALGSLARQTMAQLELRRRVAEGEADIAGRLAATDRLALSEETLRLATDAAEVGTWDLDLVNDVLTWSDRTKAMFGLPADAVCTMADFYAGLHPDDRDTTAAAFAASLDPARRTTYDVEYRTVGPDDGAVRWVAAKGRGMFDAAGRCVRALGTAIDITARRQAEQRLRDSEARLSESEAKFRAITDSIDQMVWSSGADRLCDFFNQRWYDYTGVPPGATDGTAWCQLVHPDDRARTMSVRDRTLASGDTYRTEYRLRHRSGQYRWVLARAQAVRDAGGRIVRWYGTCTEIEELVQAREVVARSRRELEREVARRTAERDQIWRSTQDLLLVMDSDGVYQAANPAWTTTLGWAVHQVVGGYYRDFMHPEDAPRPGAVKEQAQSPLLHRSETRLRHADGSYRRIAWIASSHDSLIYASGRDVTEARAAEATLAETQEQLRQSQKMEAVGQLTGGIAHDFNNMLAVVIGSLDLLGRRLDEGMTREQRYVSAAMEGARRAAQLTQRLLAFSRQQPLQPTAVDVNSLLLGMKDLLRHSLGAAVLLETALAEGVWPTHADPNQLENAVLNLAVNARDAMDDGGRLVISTRNAVLDATDAAANPGLSPGQYVLIAVADSGRGMSEAVMAKAFDPFFTTKDVGRGTGLGLSQVYGFVKQSGGYIKLASELGKGTTVTVLLPRLVGAVWSARPPPRPVSTPHGAATEVVLVVDDEADVRQMSTDALASLGYRVVAADGAEAALAALAERPDIALLFTDVMMPGTNGRKLAEKAQALRPGLPVLFTTGHVQVGPLRDGTPPDSEFTDGAHLLGKPFTLADLAIKVRAALAGRSPSEVDGGA